MEGGKLENSENNSRSRDKNQQQTQPTWPGLGIKPSSGKRVLSPLHHTPWIKNLEVFYSIHVISIYSHLSTMSWPLFNGHFHWSWQLVHATSPHWQRTLRGLMTAKINPWQWPSSKQLTISAYKTPHFSVKGNKIWSLFMFGCYFIDIMLITVCSVFICYHMHF